MKPPVLKRDRRVSYKFKINGRWTPHLRYLGETRTAYIFKACELPDPVLMFETEETYFVPKPLPPGLVEVVRCEYSGIWKKATPHM